MDLMFIKSVDALLTWVQKLPAFKKTTLVAWIIFYKVTNTFKKLPIVLGSLYTTTSEQFADGLTKVLEYETTN